MTQDKLDKANWVCHSCGVRYGSRIPQLATYHIDTCGVCGEESSCTQPRDYGYLDVKEEKCILETNGIYELCYFDFDMQKVEPIHEVTERFAIDSKLIIIHQKDFTL